MVTMTMTDPKKRIVLGFTVILRKDVHLIDIEGIRKAIESIPGVAAVEETSIPLQLPVDLM